MNIMTFKQWRKTKQPGIGEVEDTIIEEGYAWYLQSHLGRLPTEAEMRTIGQISIMLNDPLPKHLI